MKYYIFCLGFVLFSCSQKTKVENIEQRQDRVVLIFENPKVNNRYTFNNGVAVASKNRYEISYIDDQSIQQDLQLNYEKAHDTITLKSKRPLLEVTLCYKAVDQLIYFFKNGDTILFKYNGNKPKAIVINRKTLPFDVNYDITVHEKIFKNDFPGSLKHYEPLIIYYSTPHKYQDFNKELEEISKNALVQIKKEYLEENKFIDSLQKNALISKGISDLYKHSMNIKYKYHTKENYKLDTETLNTIFAPRTDSSLFFKYYQSRFNILTFKYYEDKVSRIKTDNSNLPDYRCMFDSVSQAEVFTKAEKQVLLFNILERIIEVNSKDDIALYLSKFNITIHDSLMTAYIVGKYNLDYSKTNQLQLKDRNANIIDFENLIKKHAGKLIYVDIWASWCAPCLASIPYSAKLREEYKNSDIVFLYLSKDDNFEYWKNALKKHKIEENSFIINNKYVSQFLKDINLTGIPRYLLYDKSGNLVHKNAPGPKSNNIRELINKYLQE